MTVTADEIADLQHALTKAYDAGFLTHAQVKQALRTIQRLALLASLDSA